MAEERVEPDAHERMVVGNENLCLHALNSSPVRFHLILIVTVAFVPSPGAAIVLIGRAGRESAYRRAIVLPGIMSRIIAKARAFRHCSFMQ